MLCAWESFKRGQVCLAKGLQIFPKTFSKPLLPPKALGWGPAYVGTPPTHIISDSLLPPPTPSPGSMAQAHSTPRAVAPAGA